MTVNEKREAVDLYCVRTGCEECVLKDKGWEHELNNTEKCLLIEYATEEELDIALSLINQAAAVLENGGINMETPTITISLERYDELIKKEVLFDELTKNKGINMYLFQEVKDQLREDK